MESYEKPDFWTLKAQKEEFPARSVYKLKDIDEKFTFFKSAILQTGRQKQEGLRVLDLGAAPGSWSLYILRKYGNANKTGASARKIPPIVTAVDLLSLSAGFEQYTNFSFIQGDFTSSAVREEVFSRGPYHVIISDAAPATTGNRTIDTLRSAALAEEVLLYAEKALIPGANLLVKVFQGQGTEELLKRLKKQFSIVKSFKPKACRSGSFETYFVGLSVQ